MFTLASRLVALWEEKKRELSWNRTHVPWLKLPVLRPLGYGCPANHRPSLPPLYIHHILLHVAIFTMKSVQACPYQCSSIQASCTLGRKKTALSWNWTLVPWLKLPVLRPLGYKCPASHRPFISPLYMYHITTADVAIVTMKLAEALCLPPTPLPGVSRMH